MHAFWRNACWLVNRYPIFPAQELDGMDLGFVPAEKKVLAKS